jgi:hypothetical protein
MNSIIKSIAFVAIFSTLATGCAMVAAPVNGGLYGNVKAPLAVTSNNLGSKVGVGTASSILGILSSGDASIQAAAKSAGITKISHVDYESTNILSLYATFKVYVYGE